jgi:hypothetical protein
MVVTEQNGRTIAQYRGLKYLSRMNDTGGEGTYTDRVESDHAIFAIKTQDAKYFTVCVSKILP